MLRYDSGAGRQRMVVIHGRARILHSFAGIDGLIHSNWIQRQACTFGPRPPQMTVSPRHQASGFLRLRWTKPAGLAEFNMFLRLGWLGRTTNGTRHRTEVPHLFLQARR